MRILHRFGWSVLLSLPVIYGIQIYRTQDLPAVEPWQWLVLLAAIVLTYFSRSKDDVLKHHLV